MRESLTLKQAEEKYKCRKAFVILINNKPYQVWDIDGYEHENGRMNGTTETWWLDYSDIMEERELVPYVDKMIHRICWEINYKQSNSSKFKWDEWNFTSRGECKIHANGKLIYSFNTHDLSYAMSKAQSIIVQISEHPYNFLNPEEEIGRKIWYYGLPATVKPSNSYPGEISIKPDYSVGINSERWWDLYKERSNNIELPKEYKNELSIFGDEDIEDEWQDFGVINHGDALWDGRINWFRD